MEIELIKPEKVYNDFWKCDLNVYRWIVNGKRYKVRRNDGELFEEAKDLPNEMRVAKGFEPYTYTATDIEIEEVKNEV